MGVCLVLLGVFTFLRPRSIFTGLATVYGIMAVITGICDIVIYIKEARFTGFGPAVALVSGILSMMTGIALLAHPGLAEWIVGLLFPLWFIAHCISRLAHLPLIRFIGGEFYYWFSLIVNIIGLCLGFLILIVNIIGLCLGFLMLLQPVVTFLTIGTLIAVCLVAFGIDCILMAFTDMGRPGRW